MPGTQAKFRMLFDDVEVTMPENWPSFTPTTERHQIYKTLISTFSEQKMVLYKDAKEYADAAYEADGSAAVVVVKFQEWDWAEGAGYQDIYTQGRLSFIPGKYKKLRDRTEVGFEPESFIMKLLNRDEIKVSVSQLIDMDGQVMAGFGDNIDPPFYDDSFELVLPSKVLTKSVTLQAVRDELEETVDFGDTHFPIKFNKQVGDGVLQMEQINQSKDEFFPNPGLLYELVYYTLKFIEGGDAVVTTNIHLDIETRQNLAATTPAFELYYQLGDNARVVLDNVSFPLPSSTTDKITIEHEGSFNLNGVQADDEFKIGIRITFASGGPYDLRFYPDSDLTGNGPAEISITQNTEYPITTCRGLLAWELALRLAQKMTGRNDCLRSSYLGRTDGEVYQYAEDGPGSLRFFSQVNQLRQYPLDEYPLIWSFMDFFKQLNSKEPMGMGIIYEGGLPYISIEKLTDFYDKDTMLMTVEAMGKGIEWEPSSDYIFGSARCGYSNYKEDQTGTLGTTHSPRTYTVKNLDDKVNTVYDITTDLIASPHLQENMRRKPFNPEATKDQQPDNTPIVIEVKRSTRSYNRITNTISEDMIDPIDVGFSEFNMLFEKLEGEIFDDPMVGVDNPDTAYNMLLTPARNILNHAPVILAGIANRIIASPADTDYLQFQSGEGNLQVTTTIGAITVPEGGDLDRGMISPELQTPIFNGNMAGRFEAVLTMAQRQMFVEGFTGYIAVVDHGVTYGCFVEYRKDRDLMNSIAELRVVQKVPVEVESDPDQNIILKEDGTAMEKEDAFFFELEG